MLYGLSEKEVGIMEAEIKIISLLSVHFKTKKLC